MLKKNQAPKSLISLIYKHTTEILVKNSLRLVELLRRVFLYALEFIFHSKRLVLVRAQCVVRQNLNALYHVIVLEVLAKSAYILLECAVALNKHIAQPEWVAVVLQPFGSLQCLLIAALSECLVALRIDLFDVEHYKVGQCKEFLDITVPDAAVGVKTHMYPLLMQTLYKRNKSLCLECRLATAEGNTTSLTEERFLIHGHAHNILNVGQFALALGVYRIGVGTIEATEVTSLQKNHKTQTRAVECTQ